MNRRYWPAALAMFALVLFGSFVAYTQYLLQQITEQDKIHTQMFAAVQKGINALDENSAAAAVFELQERINQLRVPLILTDERDSVTARANLPFDSMDTRRFNRYLRSLRAQRRYEPIELLARDNLGPSSYGRVYFGSPPLVGWLRWVPWLQAGAGLLLVGVAVAIVRSNVRAERERMWAAMARELAHQMGTPLSSLSGWIEVLHLPAEERVAFGGESRIGAVIGTDVERLERVSRRFELIGKPPKLEPVAVFNVVRELEEYFRPRLPKLGVGVDLRTRIASDVPMLHANLVLLVWALENVIKNAVDALAGKGGRILISAKSIDGAAVRISVADDGPGIAPEVRGRIFETGVTTKSSGWGVGLALTQRIIEDLHGGRITLAERRRGGTTFHIVLPAAGHKLRRGWLTRR